MSYNCVNKLGKKEYNFKAVPHLTEKNVDKKIIHIPNVDITLHSFNFGASYS